MDPPKGKRIGKKGGILMVSPPGRQPAKKKRRSAASFGGGGQPRQRERRVVERRRPCVQRVRRARGSVRRSLRRAPRGGADDAAARAEAPRRVRAPRRGGRGSAAIERVRVRDLPRGAVKGRQLMPGRPGPGRVPPCGHAMFCAPCAAKFRRCPQGCDGFRGILPPLMLFFLV